ncbi:hypothetical protein F5X68DRAFT_195818 [Plectosphaerella plurivora]|uniref:Uncharacterized protein n=1 Tax=Plectosphaerella plurivora TaxID=936078 RepID=A0A9P8V1E9_9PEZI|nr:hypothetical protein F5X68DRAFT_195818 [Plectosphaerella plurivora]
MHFRQTLVALLAGVSAVSAGRLWISSAQYPSPKGKWQHQDEMDRAQMTQDVVAKFARRHPDHAFVATSAPAFYWEGLDICKLDKWEFLGRVQTDVLYHLLRFKYGNLTVVGDGGFMNWAYHLPEHCRRHEKSILCLDDIYPEEDGKPWEGYHQGVGLGDLKWAVRQKFQREWRDFPAVCPDMLYAEQLKIYHWYDPKIMPDDGVLIPVANEEDDTIDDVDDDWRKVADADDMDDNDPDSWRKVDDMNDLDFNDD